MIKSSYLNADLTQHNYVDIDKNLNWDTKSALVNLEVKFGKIDDFNNKYPKAVLKYFG